MPKEWADKYKGRFAQGSDKLREETFQRQKKLGIIVPDAELTPRHAEITAWEGMPAEMKPVLERQMEVYAGFLEHTDHHIGRRVDALKNLGVLENKLDHYIFGDNGALAEGNHNGVFNELSVFNGIAALETPEFMLSKRVHDAVHSEKDIGAHAPHQGGPCPRGTYVVISLAGCDILNSWGKFVLTGIGLGPLIG